MVECFKHFQIKLPDLHALEQMSFNLLHTPLVLSIVPETTRKLRQLISDLSAPSMQYFLYVKQAHQVVTYFSEHTELHKKIDLLVAKHHGNTYGLEKLNNMFAVFEMLEPFVVLLQGTVSYHKKQQSTNAINLDQNRPNNQQRSSVTSLCENVHKYFGKRDKIEQRLKKISSLVADFDEIQVWFSQLGGLHLETIIPRISSLFQFGFFESTCTRYLKHPLKHYYRANFRVVKMHV